MKSDHPMKNWSGKAASVLVCLVVAMVAAQVNCSRTSPVPVTPIAIAPVAAVSQQAKDQAIQALLRGDFNQSTKILTDAAGRTNDPALATMARWTEQYDQQYAKLLGERKAAYDKSVSQVMLLLAAGKPDYALDAATRANSLAIDKSAFEQEPWVRSLIADRAKAAADYEQQGQWQRASRMYLDLGFLEPTKAQWKSRLKASGRFLRIQVVYAPDLVQAMQKQRTGEDEAVDALLVSANLQSATRPTSRPATRPSEDETADAKIDWRDYLKGIEYDMLWTAIEDTRENYYREASYPTLITGGLNGLRALVATTGIDSAFPTLGDAAKRGDFVRAIDQAITHIGTLKADDAEAFREVVGQVRSANRNTVDIPESVFVSEFMDGALGELDPFTSMIWPAATDDFNTQTQGEFSGVGIQIKRDESGALEVISPIEDSPAYHAGIKAGDMITHVNSEGVKGILLDQVIKKIKGPTGTKVTLTVRSPDGNVKDHTLRRDTIKVASIKGWKRQSGGGWDYMVDPVQQVGYVRLGSFTRASADELDRALQQVKAVGARGIIIDLRSDPGGLLSAAVDIADKFLSKGVIVSTRADRPTPQQDTVAKASKDRDECDLPMVILVNQFSASASEILAGAMKDHGRALVVGERTYGKGSVQMLFPVAGRSAFLKLTTSHYYLPSGRCLHREETSTQWGVEPDLVVEMTPEQMGAVMDARREMDVLRGETVPVVVEVPLKSVKKPADLLSTDPQLSAALLLMRLELSGARIVAPSVPSPIPAQAAAKGQ